MRALASPARALAAAAVAMSALLSTPAAADTVATLLGNFTINQYSGVQFARDAVTVHYTVVFGQLPALRELHVADADGDGVTSQQERDAYGERLAPVFAQALHVDVDGVAVPLHVVHATTSLPTEQGGFSLRIDADLAGVLAPTMDRARIRNVAFANRNYAGRFGWNEVVVQAEPPLRAFATNAYSTSLTGGLVEALQVLPASGPLDERAAHLQLVAGALPAGAVALGPRPGSVAPAPVATATGVAAGESAWLKVQTRRIVDAVSARDVSWRVLVAALAAALVLGALHAFAPGHGKTVVGAYLVGSRGTWRHAVFLGVTVTVTHTLGVFALGFATLLASRHVVPETLLPVLSLVSGLLVLAMGVWLLAQRGPAAVALLRARWRARPARSPQRASAALRPTAFRPATPFAPGGYVFAHAGGGHAHAASHGHAGGHAHAHLGMHSHGGRVHSHLPPVAPGERVTWRSLLALGISGGLVPCPSALVLLLAAVALNKTAYGLLLVVAFSVGLALTLTAVGIAFLAARNRMRASAPRGAWVTLLPALSAAAITLVGALLCYGAVIGAGVTL